MFRPIGRPIRVEQESQAAGSFLRKRADLFVANSGTTMRFLTAMVALGHGRYRLDGVPRMRERPIQDLLDALSQLGVERPERERERCPPVVIEAHGWTRRRSR